MHFFANLAASATVIISYVLSSQQAEPTLPATVDSLLTALEETGASLKDFQAKIVYETFDSFGEELQRRRGTIALEGIGTARRFAIQFNLTQIIVRDPDGTEKVTPDGSRDLWVYSDGWLTEVNLKRKSVIKRQVSEPGKQFDPLKLGEGPFPLPIGQPKQAVLDQFDTSLCELSDMQLLKSVTDVDGLKLVPKAGTPMAKDYSEVQVFYAKTSHALRGMHLKKADSKDTITVLLIEPKINAGLSDEQRGTLTQPDLTKPEWDPREWAIDIRPLRVAKPEREADAAVPAPTKND